MTQNEVEAPQEEIKKKSMVEINLRKFVCRRNEQRILRRNVYHSAALEIVRSLYSTVRDCALDGGTLKIVPIRIKF